MLSVQWWILPLGCSDESHIQSRTNTATCLRGRNPHTAAIQERHVPAPSPRQPLFLSRVSLCFDSHTGDETTMNACLENTTGADFGPCLSIPSNYKL